MLIYILFAPCMKLTSAVRANGVARRVAGVAKATPNGFV